MSEQERGRTSQSLVSQFNELLPDYTVTGWKYSPKTFEVRFRSNEPKWARSHYRIVGPTDSMFDFPTRIKIRYNDSQAKLLKLAEETDD